MSVLIIAPGLKSEWWASQLLQHAPDMDVCIWPDIGDPKSVEFALAWKPPVGALATLVLLQSVVTQVTHKGPCPSVFSVCLRRFPKEFR